MILKTLPYHHSATHKGYQPRKSNLKEFYIGRFGVGYTITESMTCSFKKVSYYLMPEHRKNITLVIDNEWYIIRKTNYGYFIVVRNEKYERFERYNEQGQKHGEQKIVNLATEETTKYKYNNGKIEK